MATTLLATASNRQPYHLQKINKRYLIYIYLPFKKRHGDSSFYNLRDFLKAQGFDIEGLETAQVIDYQKQTLTVR